MYIFSLNGNWPVAWQTPPRQSEPRNCPTERRRPCYSIIATLKRGWKIWNSEQENPKEYWTLESECVGSLIFAFMQQERTPLSPHQVCLLVRQTIWVPAVCTTPTVVAHPIHSYSHVFDRIPERWATEHFRTHEAEQRLLRLVIRPVCFLATLHIQSVVLSRDQSVMVEKQRRPIKSRCQPTPCSLLS